MHLAKIFGIAGIMGIGGSLFWWWSFYSDVAEFLGATGELPEECIYTFGGPCGMVSSVATALGATGYDPKLFWASVLLCVIAVAMKVWPRSDW